MASAGVIRGITTAGQAMSRAAVASTSNRAHHTARLWLQGPVRACARCASTSSTIESTCQSQPPTGAHTAPLLFTTVTQPPPMEPHDDGSAAFSPLMSANVPVDSPEAANVSVAVLPSRTSLTRACFRSQRRAHMTHLSARLSPPNLSSLVLQSPFYVGQRAVCS